MKPEKKRQLMPKLRFPEFRDRPAWQEKKLHKIAKSVSDKAADSDANKTLTLSSEYGIVPQNEYFGKKIAGKNVDRYTKIVLNDFVYNDRTTKLSTYGTIKRLSQYESGIVSPIYKCFRFNYEENPVFWEWYFESGFHDAQLHNLVNEGARAGRFNISINKFLSTSVWLPEPSEQQKIAGFLSSLDELIAAQSQKLDTLKAYKKGLMQQLFPAEGETLPRLRFPEFRDAPEWDEKRFGVLLKISSGKGFEASEYSNIGIRLLQIENVGYGKIKWNENTNFLPENYAEKYPELVLREGDIVLALNRPVTNNELKIAKLKKYDEPSVLYQRVGKVEKISDSIADNFVFHTCEKFVRNFVIKQSIGSDQPFISLMELYKQIIPIPSPPEQQKIAGCLSSLDELIAAQSQKIDALKIHKKGLMQQLFPSLDEVQG